SQRLILHLELASHPSQRRESPRRVPPVTHAPPPPHGVRARCAEVVEEGEPRTPGTPNPPTEGRGGSSRRRCKVCRGYAVLPDGPFPTLPDRQHPHSARRPRAERLRRTADRLR